MSNFDWVTLIVFVVAAFLLMVYGSDRACRERQQLKPYREGHLVYMPFPGPADGRSWQVQDYAGKNMLKNGCYTLPTALLEAEALGITIADHR